MTNSAMRKIAIANACVTSAGDDLCHRQHLDREHELLDEVPVLDDHVRRAADRFAERKPGQHAGEEVERESGAALSGPNRDLQHDAEHEEIRRHQQQRIQDRPETSPQLPR